MLETETAGGMFIPDPMAKNRPAMEIVAPRFKLRLKPDGSAEGLLGGYRTLASLFVPGEGRGEGQHHVGYQCEGMNNALRCYADGRRNASSASCGTISAAFRIKAIPAFIVHPERRAGSRRHAARVIIRSPCAAHSMPRQGAAAIEGRLPSLTSVGAFCGAFPM